MRTALVQLNASDDPLANLPITRNFVSIAAQNADFIVTPEVTNCVSTSRKHQIDVLQSEGDDVTLAALREDAEKFGVWILIGSLALKSDDPDGRFSNRSFLIGPDGAIRARYDKIHMFDVQISEAESYRESAGYRPGQHVVAADLDGVCLGLTICYDMRFPHLYRTLAGLGAKIITVPSAFSPVTGAAHWRVLLQARAIETGAFILAPAQTGNHSLSAGRPRQTYGRSIAIAPWGEVLAEAGTEPGVTLVDLDLSRVDDAREMIPSLRHDKPFAGP